MHGAAQVVGDGISREKYSSMCVDLHYELKQVV